MELLLFQAVNKIDGIGKIKRRYEEMKMEWKKIQKARGVKAYPDKEEKRNILFNL